MFDRPPWITDELEAFREQVRRFVAAEASIGDHVERGDQFAFAAADAYARQRAEAFGPAHRAVAVHEHHRLLVGVDESAYEAQAMAGSGRHSSGARPRR